MLYESFDCDVLVIGSGASGLSSAVTAASRGLKVCSATEKPVQAKAGGIEKVFL